MQGRLASDWATGRYVAAMVGAHCAFLPLLTFLLPTRVEAVSNRPVADLSLLLIAGGITASAANIVAGLLSDRSFARHGSRRSMAAAGLVSTVLALAGFALASSLMQLLALLILFQLSLNFLFAPLVAVLADHVPDHRKGITAAWLNFAIPAGTLATSASAILAGSVGLWIFPLLAAVVAILAGQFLLDWPSRDHAVAAPIAEASDRPPAGRRDFALAWIARLCVQFGAAVVLSYLYLYMGRFGTGPDFARSRLAELTLWATPFSLVAGLAVGRLSDRTGRRLPGLIASSLGLSLALAALVIAPNIAVLTMAFAVFLTALTAFLALDSALIAELLRVSHRRGWALGWMNLTNTLPAIGAPLLTIGFAVALFDPQAIRLSLSVAAVLAAAGAASIALIRTVR